MIRQHTIGNAKMRDHLVTSGWVPSKGPLKNNLSQKIAPKLVMNPEYRTMPGYFRADGLDEGEALAEERASQWRTLLKQLD